MRCRVCAGRLQRSDTDVPFKVSEQTIVIIKNLPVLQCDRCSEYLMDDPTFARVEEMLQRADKGSELEIVPFAA